ncbi:MAG TPA: glycosyltransferase family 39 protein [Vicinamibacteria bacterium]|nr:glycosyltransferase family 39 protein [Vicinamibacteria bacterium]
MTAAFARRIPAWATVVFVVALAARLGFWWLADQPLLYTHQYHYFMNGVYIAQHPDPWPFLLRTDEWRLWDGHWTIAPLYYPFEAAVFRLFGVKLEALRLVQVLLGALTAVAVGAIGRAVAGPRGYWAGALYAVHGYSVELPNWTLTENLHNVLFCAAMALLLRGVARRGLGSTAAGAALLGLSALARSVSSAFIPVAALWQWFYAERERRWKAAAAVLACGLGVILPWTARNVFIIGDLVPIETTAYENIWFANHFTDEVRFRRQTEIIHGQDSPAAKRAIAMHFALRGIRRTPGAFVDKVRANFWHFLRPEGLHHLLTAESSMEPWRHVFYVVLDDLPGLVLLPPFLAFCLGGRRTAAWALVVLWTAYYLFFEVVVFLNEVPRHRTGYVPFFLAGGVAGIALLRRAEERRRVAPWVGAGIGLLIVARLLSPYPGPAWRTVSALRLIEGVGPALDRGDLAEAERVALAAAARSPDSPRPWNVYARRLVRAGRPGEAVAAYDRAAVVARQSWSPAVARPRLLREAGRATDADAALRAAHLLSWNADPWLALETAWRELPPPRTDEVRLGEDDYGAVRGFFHPRGLDPRLTRHRLEWTRYDLRGGPQPPPGRHRWTRDRAWIRLVPTQPAGAYEVTIEMGSPFPSPLTAPEVTVRVNDGAPHRFVLGTSVAPYSVRTESAPGQPLVVRIDAPTWIRHREPAEQGVRVDRVVVAPAR